MHESATFTPIPTTIQDMTVREGQDIVSDRRGHGSEMDGAIEVLAAYGAQLHPTLWAGATPGGEVTAQAYLTIRDRLLSHLEGIEVDGVILALHGSSTVSAVTDAQGELAEYVRAAVGRDVPIVATLDLHATPSDQLLNQLDAFVAYRTAPHRDVYETGRRAAELLIRIIDSRRRPGLAYARLPLLLPGEMGQTGSEPMAALAHAAATLEKTVPGMGPISLAQGFPWADTESPGASVLVTALDESARESACAVARMLADAYWRLRDGFYRSVQVLPVAAALPMAQDRLRSRRLLYLLDSGDNPTAGAPADDTSMLRALTEWNLPAVVGAIADAPAAQTAWQAGTGARLELQVGGQPSRRPEVATTIAGRVAALSTHPEGGRMVRISTGTLEVLVSERRMGMRTPDILADLGVDPRSPDRVIVLKSGYLFPEFADLVQEVQGAESVLLATPGACSLDLRQLPYRRLRRPVFPLDQSAVWDRSVIWRPPLS